MELTATKATKLNIVGAEGAFQQLRSSEDASINWTTPGKKYGFLEARYVRRSDRYFVVYISSQTGCAQGCKMCHLTATKQTKFEDATPADMLAQARVVLDWYKGNERPAEVVHFNFMARGEALTNPHLLESGQSILDMLGREATALGVLPRFLISTILPRAMANLQLTSIFPVIHPEIYYSLYSTDDAFRRKWLPQALPVESALRLLAQWQRHTSKIPKIHYAFIEGENDSEADVHRVCEAIKDHNLRVNFNVVRYNPASTEHGREPEETVVQRNARIFSAHFPTARVKVIQRVGFDVKASCGMFVQ